MNLGQIYETVLGWAGKKLGQKFATPIFDGASVDEIRINIAIKQVYPNYGKLIFMMVKQVKDLTKQQLLV
jgi:DNA-directed RNA polymerase subunit beta